MDTARIVGMASLVLFTWVGSSAHAQQNIPARRSDQHVPGAESPLPGTVSPPGRPASVPAASDACSMNVTSADLDAVRENILERLQGNAAARESFLSEEKLADATCARTRAAFYMKVIAKIHTAKIR